MFDTMTMTKVIGGFGGALLVFLLANWAGEVLYSTEAEEHGEEEVVRGYRIDTGAEEAVEEVAEVEVAFAEYLAAADAIKGEKVFSKCKACHKLEDGANGAGPHLFGVVGREVASVAGFGYSDTVAGLGGEWDPEALSGFLENPKGFAPGTKMSFSGLKKIEDRANLIAYLQTIGG